MVAIQMDKTEYKLGSCNDARQRRAPLGSAFTPAAHPQQDAAVLATVKVRSGLAQYKLMWARRPTLTAPARGGLETHGRGGRMPAARPNQRMGRTKINLDNKSPIQAV